MIRNKAERKHGWTKAINSVGGVSSEDIRPRIKIKPHDTTNPLPPPPISFNVPMPGIDKKVPSGSSLPSSAPSSSSSLPPVLAPASAPATTTALAVCAATSGWPGSKKAPSAVSPGFPGPSGPNDPAWITINPCTAIKGKQKSPSFMILSDNWRFPNPGKAKRVIKDEPTCRNEMCTAPDERRAVPYSTRWTSREGIEFKQVACYRCYEHWWKERLPWPQLPGGGAVVLRSEGRKKSS